MTLTTKLILIAALILSIIIIRILSDRGKEPKKIQTCHRNECLFLLWRIRDYFHHDVCRPTGTGR